MRDPLLVEREYRSERAEHGIAVIGPAAPIELVALEYRRPGTHALCPPDHLGLLVQMTIEQDRIIAGTRHLDQNDRRAVRKSDDFERGALQTIDTRTGPALEQGDCLVHMAVHRPIRVEGGRLVGNADVVDERRNCLFRPKPVDEIPGAGGIEHVGASLMRDSRSTVTAYC